MACATTLGERGHKVTLFDARSEIGGQFNLARRIPGKEVFGETLRYFRYRLPRLGVTVKLGGGVGSEDLKGFDHVVLATGITPRMPAIPDTDYDALLDRFQTLGFDRARFVKFVQTPDQIGQPGFWSEGIE